MRLFCLIKKCPNVESVVSTEYATQRYIGTIPALFDPSIPCSPSCTVELLPLPSHARLPAQRKNTSDSTSVARPTKRKTLAQGLLACWLAGLLGPSSAVKGFSWYEIRKKRGRRLESVQSVETVLSGYQTEKGDGMIHLSFSLEGCILVHTYANLRSSNQGKGCG